MRKQSWFTILITVALLANLVVGYRVYSNDQVREGEDKALAKIAIMMRVLHLIRQDYVLPDSTDYELLITNALHGMVSSLDPHSSYLEPADFGDMIESTEGQFGGLGVLVTVRDGFLTVISPMEGTPGAKAGLLPGDLIVEIDGQSTEGEKLEFSVRRLKGLPGTQVTIKVVREGGQPFSLTIERAIIEVPSVKHAQMLRNGIAYVRIAQFDDNTVSGLQEALKEFRKQEMKGLVVDLRSNPGGLLRSAVDVCSLFLERRKLVVSTEGRRPSQNEKFETGGGPKYLEVPLAIIVNGGSASAAEIVAGCLQDWERAVLVGEKTFGKGSVQNLIQLPDGSALRLTTAMYYTPSRRVIHEHGIEPDVPVPLSVAEQLVLVERQRQANGQPVVDPAIDPQLARALESLESYRIFQGVRRVAPKPVAEVAAGEGVVAEPAGRIDRNDRIDPIDRMEQPERPERPEQPEQPEQPDQAVEPERQP